MRRWSASDRLAEGIAAQDFRASRARAWRRHDAGEPVEVCFRCGTEVDVPVAAHASFCVGGRPRFAGRLPVEPAGEGLAEPAG